MRKLRGRSIVSGSCMMVVGVCACVTMAGEPAGAKPEAFPDSFLFAPAHDARLSPVSKAGDTRDEELLVAQAVAAGGAAGGAVGVAGQASNAGASVGLTKTFGTWSDLTAMFRPSRWRSPFREGGSLSWLNYKSWANAPGRTCKVLTGEAVVVVAAIMIGDYNRKNDDPIPASTTPSTPPAMAASAAPAGPSPSPIPIPPSTGSGELPW